LKNTILIASILLLTVACKQEEINGYDSLTAQERENIRARGTKLCEDQATPIFNRFKTESNKSFTSSAFSRGKVFSYEFKEGETIVKTVDLKVWKQTADAIYFIVSDSKASFDYFLRVLKSDNDKIINDLQVAHCSRPVIYASSVGNNGPLTIVNDYELPKAPNDEVYKDTYTLSFGTLAYLGSFNLSRNLKVQDSEDRTVGTAKNYTTTPKNSTVTYTSNDWSDSSLYTQHFCSLNSAETYRFSKLRNVEGFKIDLNDCLTAEPTGWNLDI
jgi:hypothetical protein